MALFFFNLGTRGEARSRRETSIKTAEIGRVRKIMGFPAERSSERRKAASSMGPRTRARTNGAASYSNFLNR